MKNSLCTTFSGTPCRIDEIDAIDEIDVIDEIDPIDEIDAMDEMRLGSIHHS